MNSRTMNRRPPTVRLLIVDDQPFVRKRIQQLAEKIYSLDIQVIGATDDWKEVNRLLDTARPDVITMDIEMPKLGGKDVLQEVLNWDPDARVIILSAVEDTGAHVAMLNMGARTFLSKNDLSHNSLEVAIHEALA